MTWFIDALGNTSHVTQVMVSIALIMICGYLMSRLTKLAKLPNVTGYILAGILIGPYCLNLIPSDIVTGLDFLSDIALAFIAFSIGEYLKFSNFKKHGKRIVVITLFESLISVVLVFVVLFFILKLNLSFCLVLSALSAATAPASTIMTIRQTKAKGEFVDTSLQVIALDNVISIVMFSVALSVAIATLFGGGVSFDEIGMPLLKNFIALVVGIGLGFLLKVLIKSKLSSDNRLIIAVCTILAFCGIASFLDVSPLLGCMAIGTIYSNFAKDETLFLQLNYFSPPLLLMFFVKSGLGFNFSALFSSSNYLGISLLLVGVVYFVVRIIGKYLGAFCGAVVTHSPKSVKKYLGLTLIPQAGVAIGLVALGARSLGGELGETLQTIILASSILYELVGPICAKLSLYWSGSIANIQPKKLRSPKNVSKEEKAFNQASTEFVNDQVKQLTISNQSQTKNDDSLKKENGTPLHTQSPKENSEANKDIENNAELKEQQTQNNNNS